MANASRVSYWRTAGTGPSNVPMIDCKMPMQKIISARFTAIVATLLIWLPIIDGTAETVARIVRNDILLDPLFGIEFRPTQVKFEPAPNAVYTCKDLAERRGNLF